MSIEVEDLSYIYMKGTPFEKSALKNINLKINTGEFVGIIGHTGNRAIVVQYDEDILNLQPGVPTLVMAQTTISPAWFDEMTHKIRDRVGEVEVKDTLCRFVVRRDQKLPAFARRADVILVVGGHKSSNTKMLHSTCKAINPRSYHVADLGEVDPAWCEGASSIGVTGSASTPLWLLHEFMVALEQWERMGWIKQTVSLS